MNLSFTLPSPTTSCSPITGPYLYQSVVNPNSIDMLDTQLPVVPSAPLSTSYWRLAEAASSNELHANLSANATTSNCNSKVLYRPTPIHPVSVSPAKNFKLLQHPSFDPDHSDDLPLDLSCSGEKKKLGKNDADAANRKKRQHEFFLPTCVNSNSTWIASKLSPNRMSYPREFKLMVIDYYKKYGQNKYRTCKEFQITKSMLNGWLQKAENILQSRPGSLKSGRSGRKPQFPDIEKQLFELYCSQIESGRKVGNRWIRETAKTLAQQQCSKQELAGMCRFSERWLSNFKKRYHIHLHRKWLGTNSISSVETTSTESNGIENAYRPSFLKSETICDFENSEMEDRALDCESVNSETLNGLIENDSTPSPSESLIYGQEQAKEVLNKPGQLPILTFYERFPWLCKKNAIGTETGRRGRKVQFPDVERILFDRLQAKQELGERVSNRWLQEQARKLAMKLCPQVLREATKSARCLFSEHWLHNFKKRYDICLKSSSLKLSDND